MLCRGRSRYLKKIDKIRVNRGVRASRQCSGIGGGGYVYREIHTRREFRVRVFRTLAFDFTNRDVVGSGVKETTKNQFLD